MPRDSLSLAMTICRRLVPVLVPGVAGLVLAATLQGAPPSAPFTPSFVLPGRVVQVTDGDTAVVELDSGRVTVRFHGMDAPEMKQPFGRQARQALEQLIGGHPVRIQPVEQDRYERMVAVVYAGDTNINAQMIEEGQAWAYRRYLGQVSGDGGYCDLEAAARTAGRGLWSQPPERWVPPWIYRQRAGSLPGTAVPSKDYRGETARDCQAAIGAGGGRPAAASASGPGAPDPGCAIKGNINGKGERIYHLPGSPAYADTRISPGRGERWFCSEEQARAAGWRPVR